MRYKTETLKIPDSGLIYQMFFDSSDNSYHAVVYKQTGGRVKVCEKSLNEKGAEENMFRFLQTYQE
jgi:hypothetical protein